LSENDRLFVPKADVKSKLTNDVQESTNFEAQNAAAAVQNAAETGNERSKEYVHSVDSGVAVSSDKRSEQNGLNFSPKRNRPYDGKANGVLKDGNEDAVRQRLIA